MQHPSSLLNWWLIHSFSGCHTTSLLIVSCLVFYIWFDQLCLLLSCPHEGVRGECVGAQVADLMATLYDVGGILGKTCTHLLPYE